MHDRRDDGISHGPGMIRGTTLEALREERMRGIRKICRRTVVGIAILGVIAALWAIL